MPDLQNETQPQAPGLVKPLYGKVTWAIRLGWLVLTFIVIYTIFRKRLRRLGKKLRQISHGLQ